VHGGSFLQFRRGRLIVAVIGHMLEAIVNFRQKV
jgi:hypothetical protein